MNVWKPVCTVDEIYLMKYEKKEKLFTFHLTNIKFIWTKQIAEDLIISTFQECNPTLDIKVEDATEEIISLLDNVDKVKITIEKQVESVIMNMSNVINLQDSELEILLNVELNKAEQEMFTEMVTVPMIQTIYFLQKQQLMLCNLLKKKDLELEQYRLEKDQISRTDLVTEKFDESTLKTSSNKLILNVFVKADKFMEKLGQQYGDIEEKVESVAVHPWNQVKKKRKIYNSSTALKKKRNEIIYKSE